MRDRRLLKRSETGSAPVEATFAIVLLMTIVLGVIEIAFALYARNVVGAAAHEAARTAIEFGRDIREASQVADHTVRTAAGGLITNVRVDVQDRDVGAQRVVVVRVEGRLKPFGPVPIALPFSETAHATARR